MKFLTKLNIKKLIPGIFQPRNPISDAIDAVLFGYLLYSASFNLNYPAIWGVIILIRLIRGPWLPVNSSKDGYGN